MSRRHLSAVALAALIGWETRPGFALTLLLLVCCWAVIVAELVAAHRRGRRRLKRAGY